MERLSGLESRTVILDRIEDDTAVQLLRLWNYDTFSVADFASESCSPTCRADVIVDRPDAIDPASNLWIPTVGWHCGCGRGLESEKSHNLKYCSQPFSARNLGLSVCII